MIPKKRLHIFAFAGKQSTHHRQQTTNVCECNLDEVMLDVESAVNKIAHDYHRTRGFILSEDDLKCALYHKLYRNYSYPFPTLDQGISATALHTEIPWYDENGLLTLRPDLSIIDPRKLSILHGIGEHTRSNVAIHYRLPSKGFEFGGQAVAIETKFVRSLAGISHRHILSFQKDINKMNRICERHNRNSQTPNVKGVLVVFSKTRKGNENINEFKRQNSRVLDISIIYRAGEIL